MINLKENFTYDETKLLQNDEYILLFDLVKKMNKIQSYNIILTNSIDMVSYLMILMNYFTAKTLIKHKNGIFRCNSIKDANLNDSFHKLDNEIKHFMKYWNSNAGQYISYQEFINDKKSHEMLHLDAYLHITSPIRRIVDLLNMIILQNHVLCCTFSVDSNTFLNYWSSRLEYINLSMTSIRKIQLQAKLLELCMKNPKFHEKQYNGFVFDKSVLDNAMFQYNAYIPSLKIVSRIISNYDRNDYDKCLFRIYTFQDEDQYKKKVRIDLVD